MKTLVSKIATMLLASIILSASCLSCLIQAMPVYAAASPDVELGQNKDCENEQNPLREEASTIKTPLIAILTTITLSSSDRSTHKMMHGTGCSPTYSQTSFVIKRLQPADIHFTNAVSPFISHTDRVYHQWSLAPPRNFSRNTISLTGTTIKKE